MVTSFDNIVILNFSTEAIEMIEIPYKVQFLILYLLVYLKVKDGGPFVHKTALNKNNLKTPIGFQFCASRCKTRPLPSNSDHFYTIPKWMQRTFMDVLRHWISAGTTKVLFICS